MAEASSTLNETNECPICLTKIRTKGVIECMHTFCITCIKEWRGNKQTQYCPICKSPFQDILKIRTDGTSQVSEPKRRQTVPRAHSSSIRPTITNVSFTNSPTYREFMDSLNVFQTAAHLTPMFTETETETMVPEPEIPLEPPEEYIGIFFCPCGNSWESQKSYFIVDQQTCQHCKREVSPEY
ncbi:hypothetical protein LOD99_9972 [Oopsacas minuta]|uniref:RING-type E3 ubiquitin transferase n=1 Tax=Oopsacas minuta TaxID=111878 RepID=A0AAV7KMF7_9METZ|nr:hypothetical protein LOD99_9972 [Oopsacas minuta]